ncbi:MAG TPA: hypothetical protein VM053_05865 [Gemmatimonadaceae bacterium]|nr:hypothetical protein [Gemmatimonadaceae bacterium]
MMALRYWLPLVILFALATSDANAQGAALTPQQASRFLGTWMFTMTEPSPFAGTTQTVRVWDENGRVAASVQTGKFPPNNVTGILVDGDMLVLTLSHDADPPMRENGASIWAVVALAPDADEMRIALMLERSQTIKRGTGKRQP